MIKKLIAFLMLLSLMLGACPVILAIQPFDLSEGELRTTDFNAWGGVNGTVYTSVPFNVDAAGIGNVGLTMYVYGLDMSRIFYEGGWIWPPDLSDLGAIADFGVTGTTSLQFDMQNAAWFQLHSSCGSGGGTWNDQSGKYNHTYGSVRKWLIQGWHRGETGGKVFPDDPTTQYNIERFVPNDSMWGSTYMPGYNQTYDEYQTFDFKIQYTPLGSGQYKMQGWVRMHAAASWDEMWYLNWPYKWQWNKAMNNVANPEDAWLKIGGHQPDGGERIISGCNFSMAYPFISVANWGTTQTQYHFVSWERVVIEGTPTTSPPEMWVDDDWAGLPNGTEVQPGKFIGYNAFALIQGAINAANPSTSIWVYDGTYNENLVIGKTLTIQAASRPTIDGGAAGDCVTVNANNVVVNGFEIRNGYNGISGQTSSSTFSNNVIHDNLDIPGSAGVGILLWGDNDNNIITANEIYDNDRQGIFIGFSDTAKISTGNIISENIIYNNGLYRYTNGPDASEFGIQLWTADGNIIQNNEIYDHDDWFPYGGTFDFAQGIYLCDSDNNLVTENDLHNNNYAVGLWHPTRIVVTNYISYNDIWANTGYGVRTFDGPPIVDARFNWWGHASGPAHSSNSGGTGGVISDNVDYSPWLGMAVGSTPMTWHVNPTGTIQEAIDEAKSGDTILVHSGTYNEALYITKTLTIQAASAPVIQGSQLFATNYGNREVVIFVENAQNVVLNGLDIEGLGLGPVKSYAVLYENSSGMIYNCTVSPNTIGDMNSVAIAAWDNSVVTIAGCTIQNFGRIGVYSNNATMSIVGNTIIGQVYAADNLVNYGIEIEDYSGPSIATITQNVIYNCNNTHPNPSWSSAAIIVDTWREWADIYGLTLLASKVSITYNTIYDNYESIEIVSNEFSYAHYNNFTNNAWGVWSAPENWTTNPTYYVFDARFNWWGDASGPHHTTSWMYNGNPYGPHFGSGDEVSDYVLYDPWTGLPLPTISVEPPLIEKQMVNTTFAVNITISNLSGGYRAVGFQFRLLYDSELIEAINVTEGPFLEDPMWNPEGTFFTSSIEVDPVYGPCVLVGILVLPNDTGSWEAFPVGNGTLATITFRTLTQETGLEKLPLTCGLTLVTTQIINDDLEEIQHNTNNGLYKMYPTNAADINRDYKVDMKDIGIAARAFGTVPGDERWNPLADITGPITWVPDGRIDMRDIGVIARNFGWRPLDDP